MPADQTPRLTLVPGSARRRRDPLLRHVVGGVLRAERTTQGRTLAEVAGVARVSLPYLSEVERGRKEPSSEVLAAVCEALDLTLLDLLRRSASSAALTTTSRPVRSAGGATLSIAA